MTRKFTATAHRSGDWWAIEVTSGLPADALGVTQARRLSDVDEATRDVIADILEVEADDVDVDVEVIVPDELSEFVALFRHADSFEAAAAFRGSDGTELGGGRAVAISPHYPRGRSAPGDLASTDQAAGRSCHRRRTGSDGRRSPPNWCVRSPRRGVATILQKVSSAEGGSTGCPSSRRISRPHSVTSTTVPP